MAANVFELFATISLDTDEYERKLKDSENKTSTFADVLKANLASGAIIAGVKKLAGVVADVGKAAYTSYARYEQLAGGAQLMFGDAYDFVAEKARNAYKTVQMSQNDYLQQVNGFATGLKTALGGNVQRIAAAGDGGLGEVGQGDTADLLTGDVDDHGEGAALVFGQIEAQRRDDGQQHDRQRHQRVKAVPFQFRRRGAGRHRRFRPFR